ncbi:hypothetical protein OGAPHI_002636 [Ogataea philodendri]|uniref:EF-hand domain-containing protein n=1 Tax=Ogataea philodendri TaxID=1378263 RepID=A0A9P8T7J3_9ASCO|nr:uncharacterized protein OGAPHI_002636 [Ogataea philodendri]KAH3668881.1 hypothetical protein OGAPHI_002636 [Ogataea philodendri]
MKLIGVLLFGCVAFAHQQDTSHQELGEKIPAEFEGSWQRWHMKEEHNLDHADPSSVFLLHDYRNVKRLNDKDILRMYGLMREEIVGKGDGTGSHDNTEIITKEMKNDLVRKVMALIDKNGDGEISFEEWLEYSKNGGEFPDFGFGPGHEYDFEEEYEKHHWLQYHAESDPDVNIQHAEDIEHELLHHLHEIEHEAPESESGYNKRVPIREFKIPKKFQS